LQLFGERDRIRMTLDPDEATAESIVLVEPGDPCAVTRTITVPDEEEAAEDQRQEEAG
jgi:hypothetical protein